ncbi:hypothetical protein MF271_06315 [Deinococcus sp. KNUC1210]|uniref:hypothetical protein n=1 Tax=Deinococcus sp. KNUC1210 TaxID=2917691 RepID=UPI001EF10D95|nr:hypothetical protein [Deinococcus sp. KNUC1210]ULH16222.1 hypothetical protein MF271_06315 [Deinococcus sp. KNUC1210]
MKIARIGAPLLLLGLALTACGASTPPPPAQAQVITSINGVSDAFNTPVTLSGAGRTLATSQTDASGHFTLDLPSDAAAAGVAAPLSTGVLSDLGCTGTLVNSDPAASGYEVASLKMGSASYMNATVNRGLLSRALRGKVYLYADRSTNRQRQPRLQRHHRNADHSDRESERVERLECTGPQHRRFHRTGRH